MKTSEQINEIAGALAKAQGEMERAKKDSSNPHFKSKYADLASCWDACQGPLTNNGIAVVQANVPTEKGVTVETRLVHSSGQWIQDDGLFVPATKIDAQGFGSAETYARRYALCAMVGIAPEEDDGNAAVASAPKRTQKATADKVAAEHGMTTADKLPPKKPVTFEDIKAKVAALKADDPEIIDKLDKAENFIKGEHTAGRLTDPQKSDLDFQLAEIVREVNSLQAA